MPILLFIGLEITAQSFHVTPTRHFAALALACMPAVAKLIVLKMGTSATLTLEVLAGGFIITSLIWASALAKIIDRKLSGASIYFSVAGILVLFGVIHSPINDQMFLPWDLNKTIHVNATRSMFDETQREAVSAHLSKLQLDDGQRSALAQAMGQTVEDPTVQVEVPVFDDQKKKVVIQIACAYLLTALLLFILGTVLRGKLVPIDSDQEFEDLVD